MANNDDGENPNILQDLEMPDFANEEELFLYLQKQKHTLYNAIRPHALAGDVKSVRAAEALLKSMENQPIQLKKIAVEDKAATNMGEFAKAIADALDGSSAGIKRHDGGDVPSDYTPEFDTSAMPEVKLKDGVSDTGSNDVDLDSIISEGLAKSGGNRDED